MGITQYGSVDFKGHGKFISVSVSVSVAANSTHDEHRNRDNRPLLVAGLVSQYLLHVPDSDSKIS